MYTKKTILLGDQPVKKEATIYRDEQVKPRSAILYLHGGGLIFGSRDDLPSYHLKRLTEEGHVVIATDYLLAPVTKLEDILSDLEESLASLLDQVADHLGNDLPYFIWGRSAGAFLSLYLAGKGRLAQPVAGVVSFYGYAFMVDDWYRSKNAYFNKTYPALDASWLDQLPDEPRVEGDLRDAMGAYVYARQTGKWKDIITGDEGSDPLISLIKPSEDIDFLQAYSLRDLEEFPVPLFIAHATGDFDVPYTEFIALEKKFKPTAFSVESDEHDFDRNTASDHTTQLMDAMLTFLDDSLADQ